MAVPKSRQYKPPGGGGGGGGLGSILSMMLGVPYAPELEGGEVLGEAQGPGLPSEAIGPQTAPMKVGNKPSWWQNVTSRGQAGQQYGQLQNNLKLGEFDNALKQQLLTRQLAGGQDLERLRTDNDIKQEGLKFGNAKSLAELNFEREKQLKDLSYKNSISEADIKDALARGFGQNIQQRNSVIPALSTSKAEGDLFQQNLLNEARRTPDMATAIVQNEYAGLEKQPLANQMEKQNILASQKKLPTLGFMNVSEGNSMVDPLTGQVISNVASRELDPAKDFRPGGITSKTLPGYSPAGGFAKVPGGVNAELSGGGGQPQTNQVGIERGFGTRPNANLLPSPEAQVLPQPQGPPVPLPITLQNQPFKLNPVIDPNAGAPLNQMIQHYIEKGIAPAIQGSQMGNWLSGQNDLFEGSQLGDYLKRRKLLQQSHGAGSSW
jgi:hypothetical protein